jgi:hypothetical protein
MLIAALAVLAFWASPSSADLSASGAFTLIRKIPPGEEISEAAKFLGEYESEKTVDAKEGIKIRRWGTPKDEWVFDVLHDGVLVRATRITWVTGSRREQQTIFAQLTSEGKKFFGKTAVFHGFTEAEWTDFGEKWLVLARQGDGPAGGVALLSGIRDAVMDSGKYGF